MRLASITLPQAFEQAATWPTDSGGYRQYDKLTDGHNAITRHLIETYRGYTRLDAKGAWVGPNGKRFYEDVYRYEFACEDNEQKQSDLRALAFRVKVLTDEQSIMVVHANGEVEFI